MTKGDEKKLDVFATKCLRRVLKIPWIEHIINKIALERAGMKNMSDEAHRKRCKYIGHILRKETDNDCLTTMTWAPKGRRKSGRSKTTWRRTVENENCMLVDGKRGMGYEPKPPTGRRGDGVRRPYVPLGTKWTGNR